MKVKELIAKLQEFDPEFDIIISKDAEGNSYSPLAYSSDERYRAENTWSGELEQDGRPNCVCLWPTN